MRRTAKSALAIALAASLIASGVGTSEAKAKKPTLSTTKVTITKGKTKKITVKKVKPAKTTWSVNKAGKKVVKLSSKKKTSVTIKGMKAGKATVTAKIKVGKKVYTKTVKVTVKNKAAVKPTAKPTAKPTSKPTATPTAGGATATPTAEAPTATPNAGDATATPTAEAPTATPTAEAPTATPTATAPAQVSGMLDLSQAKKDIEGTPADYDAATGTVSAKGISKLLIPLLGDLAPGEEATFVVKGTKGGSEPFRAYLDPGSDAALSDILFSDKDGKVGTGEFTWTFTLKNTKEAAATYIMFKGKDWQTPIDDLTIKSIEFSKGQKEEPAQTDGKIDLSKEGAVVSDGDGVITGAYNAANGYYEMTVPKYTAAIIENKVADRNKYTAVKFTYTSDAAFDLYAFDDKITDAKGQTPDGQHMSQTLAATTEAKTITVEAGNDYSGKCITAIKIVNMGSPAHLNIKDVEFLKSTTEPTATATTNPGGSVVDDEDEEEEEGGNDQPNPPAEGEYVPIETSRPEKGTVDGLPKSISLSDNKGELIDLPKAVEANETVTLKITGQHLEGKVNDFCFYLTNGASGSYCDRIYAPEKCQSGTFTWIVKVTNSKYAGQTPTTASKLMIKPNWGKTVDGLTINSIEVVDGDQFVVVPEQKEIKDKNGKVIGVTDSYAGIDKSANLQISMKGEETRDLGVRDLADQFTTPVNVADTFSSWESLNNGEATKTIPGGQIFVKDDGGNKSLKVLAPDGKTLIRSYESVEFINSNSDSYEMKLTNGGSTETFDVQQTDDKMTAVSKNRQITADLKNDKPTKFVFAEKAENGNYEDKITITPVTDASGNIVSYDFDFDHNWAVSKGLVISEK